MNSNHMCGKDEEKRLNWNSAPSFGSERTLWLPPTPPFLQCNTPCKALLGNTDVHVHSHSVPSIREMEKKTKLISTKELPGGGRHGVPYGDENDSADAVFPV